MKLNKEKNNNTKIEDSLYRENILKEWIKELLIDYSKYQDYDKSCAAKKLSKFIKTGEL